MKNRLALVVVLLVALAAMPATAGSMTSRMMRASISGVTTGAGE